MEKIKSVISQFIDKPPAEIVGTTLIDKSVIKGSILIHRMYAALAAEGISIKNYSSIKTFDNLVEAMNDGHVTNNNNLDLIETGNGPDDIAGNVGIDIEAISNMPVAEDYREHLFYRQNFTPKEISYCSLKSTPLQSFAGLFCAKEALCKVNPLLAKKMFNEIEISHNTAGRPMYDGYLLSISHTENMAVAVAVKHVITQNHHPVLNQTQVVPLQQIPDETASKKNNIAILILSLIAITMSICSLALFILMIKKVL